MNILTYWKRQLPLRKIILGSIAALVLVGIFLLGWVFYIIKTLPSQTLLENRTVAESTKIYDRTGKVLLYEIYGEEKRTVIPFDEIPDVVKKATVAIEDENFYTHDAVDWKSILRAFVVNALNGKVVQGGSTITQQLAKNAFLTDDRTFSRKIKELILAIQLERRYTKDEILELYLNQIPYGSNAYGIESASQTFFAKPAKDLDIAEAALLAGLPKAPSYYSPYGSNVKELLARRDFIINKLASTHIITPDEQKAALAEKPDFAAPSQGIRAPHFVIQVQNYLNDRYGEDFVKTHGLKVTTTLDNDLQTIAEAAVEKGAENNEKLYKGSNAALVAEDPKTGQILALVGSRDYFDVAHDGNFDVASQGLRQPGSATKPFIYAAAFQKGYTPDTVLFDLQTEFDTTGDPQNSYTPQDYDGLTRGPVTLRRALAQSLNIPAVKVLYLVGIDNALSTLRAFGLSTLRERSRYGLSLVLGGGEVHLTDLVGAYSALAQDGIHHDQSMILKVETKDGTLEEYKDNTTVSIDPQNARLVNDILSDQDARAAVFGSSLSLPGVYDHQVAVKTGTSNDYRDAWAIGYTSSLAVGVWAGNNDNTPMTKAGGNLAAAPIWKDVMSKALASLPGESFTKPDDEPTPQKPVLRGEYLVNYMNNTQTYPQLHEILFYVNRDDPTGPQPQNPSNDPQFNNWEKPVLDWGKTNIPNFASYNQPIPDGSSITSSPNTTATNPITVTINSPTNGSFISNQLPLDVTINSVDTINLIEVRFNDQLIDSRGGDLAGPYHYTNTLNTPVLDEQNTLTITAHSKSGATDEEKVILFKQP